MITNTPTLNEEIINVNRAQIEHRATWMGLIFDEMEKEGIDAERIIRKAIKRCGIIHGEKFKAACQDPKSCEDFNKAFLGEVGVKTFEMTDIEPEYDNLKTTFHYCALVSAWKKLGFSDERIDMLCDMAMDGDRGIAEAMGLTLNLSETIAKGCDSCKLHFHK